MLSNALRLRGEWQAAWRSAVVEIHLAPTAEAAEAEAALGAWEAITRLSPNAKRITRYKGLNEDLDHFRVDVAALVAELGESSLVGAPIERIVRDLKIRLDAAKAPFKSAPTSRTAPMTSERPSMKRGNSTGRRISSLTECGELTDSLPTPTPTIWRAARLSAAA